jgi:MFS family permease
MAPGPLLGGSLSTYFSWRWAFFINVPIMIIAVIGTRATVTPIHVKLKQKGYDVLGLDRSGAGTDSVQGQELHLGHAFDRVHDGQRLRTTPRDTPSTPSMRWTPTHSGPGSR